MASPTGLFYAYAKHTTTDWAWRYLIIFANRATADEWWRAVTDSVVAGYKRFDGVQRVSLQFYVHNPDVNRGNISETINDDRCAKQFLGRVIFTLLNDKGSRIIDVAPTLNYTDHISGRGFFIRSILHPNQYWFFDGRNTVVSDARRTKFVITIQGQPSTPPNGRGMVMIGTDIVTINIFNTQDYLYKQNDGELSTSTMSGLGVSYRFADFDGSFRVALNNTVTFDGVGAGEPWELV